MCARVTSTYMEFTFTFGPKLEFKNTFKLSKNSPTSAGGEMNCKINIRERLFDVKKCDIL